VLIPKAGFLVTVYALGVMIGAPLMTLGTSRLPRHHLLVGPMGIYTLGNLLSARSTSYTAVLLSRIVTSLNQGAFFGVGSVVAASLVPAHRRADAVATMFMGLTIANVGGVPLASWVGEVVGWRTAFGGMAAIGLCVMAALWFALPRDAQRQAGDLRRNCACSGARPSSAPSRSPRSGRARCSRSSPASRRSCATRRTSRRRS